MKTYIAHFSFDIEATDQSFTGGRVTAVVQATHLAKAAEKLQALLHDAKARVSMLHRVKRIDLETLTEMKTIPPQGLITLIQWDDRESDATLEVTPAFAEERHGVTIYAPGDAPDTDEVPPFVEFD